MTSTFFSSRNFSSLGRVRVVDDDRPFVEHAADGVVLLLLPGLGAGEDDLHPELLELADEGDRLVGAAHVDRCPFAGQFLPVPFDVRADAGQSRAR